MRSFISGLAIVLFTASAHGEISKASIFAIGETSKAPLYTQETEKTTVGDLLSWSSVIKDKNGAVVMREQTKIKNGLVIKHEIDHLQINERYELELKDGKVIFQTFKIVDGKPKLSEQTERDAPGEYLMGPSTEMFLQKHFDRFAAKRSAKIDFGVFELQRFVAFKFSGVSNTDDKIEIKMKPANFFISALVDTITITMDKKKRKMIYFKGRTPLRETKSGKLKPFDAEIIYH